MTKTTPLPPINILQALPELANLSAITIRLHPRRGEVPDRSASKIGGIFLWPDDEAWLTVPYNPPLEFVPVLQINAKDVPEFPFPAGKDLMQLLWLPDDYDWCLPRLYWRASASIRSPLAEIPPSRGDKHLIPRPCTLTFERILEYPSVGELSKEQIGRLESLDIQDLVAAFDGLSETEKNPVVQYQYNLSVCPGNKLGGHVAWMQDPEWQTCKCGRRMEHLLTLTEFDVDGGSWRRWLPLEDRELWRDPWEQEALTNAPGWWLGGGAMYYFVCRSCEDWPVKSVYQR